MNASDGRQRFLPAETASLGPRNEVGNATEFVSAVRAADGRNWAAVGDAGWPVVRSYHPAARLRPWANRGRVGAKRAAEVPPAGQDKEV